VGVGRNDAEPVVAVAAVVAVAPGPGGSVAGAIATVPAIDVEEAAGVIETLPVIEVGERGTNDVAVVGIVGGGGVCVARTELTLAGLVAVACWVGNGVTDGSPQELSTTSASNDIVCERTHLLFMRICLHPKLN
jgi:hypothetical protein